MALLLLLGLKLPAFLDTPAGQRLLGAKSDSESAGDDHPVAIGLAEALDRLGIDRASIERRLAPQPVTGRPGAEWWTIPLPRKLSLVECNRAIAHAAAGLHLEIQDAWEHRAEDGGWPALSISLATGARGATSGLPRPARRDGRERRERYRLTFVLVPPADRGLIAVVIDDFGFSWNRTAQKFLEFPEPLTLAVLPGYKSSQRVAEAARRHGFEVLLHIPMEPENYPRVKPGPDAILLTQKPAEVRARLRAALKSVGPVRGISNHMGSLATTDSELMRVVLEEVLDQGLYFLDSCTTPHSVVEKVARRAGTPCLENRLFLDNDRSADRIAKQIDEAARIALETGEVVVIGHVYPETLAALSAALPRLEQQQVRLATLSELVPRPWVD